MTARFAHDENIFVYVRWIFFRTGRKQRSTQSWMLSVRSTIINGNMVESCPLFHLIGNR